MGRECRVPHPEPAPSEVEGPPLPRVGHLTDFLLRRRYSSSSSTTPRAALDAVMIFSCNCAGTMS